MKFHAYPKLLIAVGALAISLLGGVSANAVDSSVLEGARSTSNAAAAVGSRNASAPATRQQTLLNLLGMPQTNGPARAAVCGDSEPDAGEECDDGNLLNGDGCDATCLIEAPWDCTAAIAGSLTENIIVDGSFENNDPAWTLVGSAFNPRCSVTTCGPDLATDGDIYLWIGGGFFTAGNDATATQTLVIPANASTLTFEWANGSNALPAGTCESPNDDLLEVLIDGVQVFRTVDPCAETFPFETVSIDLVALGYNDGLSHTIQFHGVNVDAAVNPGDFLTNFFLDNVQVNIPAANPVPPTPSACFMAVCGDSIWSYDEACDDGNTVAGDGCSATCTVEEPDFVCSDPTLDSFDILANATGDAIREGSLEDRRGRQTGEWDEIVDSVNGLLPICSEVFCSFIPSNISSDGIFYGLFGASADPSDTSIEQITTIPTTATVLTFDFFVASPAVPGPCDSTADFLEVTVDGTQVFLYDCTVAIDEYTQQSADISAFADGLDHTIAVRGVTESANTENTNFFVDNISIPLPGAAVPTPSSCITLPTACAPTEDFTGGIPANWTVLNLSVNPADGWGTTGDGICLAENASPLVDFFGNNLTSGTGGAACVDSDAVGQVDIDGGGTETEVDTYLCTNAYDLTNITAPSFSFTTNYQSADNQFNDNGTPTDPLDDFDEDLLEVLVGTSAPNALTIGGYTRLGGINDHEDGDLILTANQELRANLEGTLEGSATGYVCFHYKGTYDWFGQIDNATLRGDDCNLAPLDTDEDGVFDSVDNCTLKPNGPLTNGIPNGLPEALTQRDTNGDGYGNACDPDTNNNGIVEFGDVSAWPPFFNQECTSTPAREDNDFNGDGFCNFGDYSLFPEFFQQPPGPAAIDNQ